MFAFGVSAASVFLRKSVIKHIDAGKVVFNGCPTRPGRL